MPTEIDVKQFLMGALPEARKQGIGKVGLAMFLQKYGIAIKGVELNMNDGKSYLLVEYVDDEEIKEARFSLSEVDGRSEEEIIKELDNENV